MPTFKNIMGTRFLKELFYETTGADKTNVVYTLKTEDHLNYPSLYKIYMSYDDPLEYQFALDNFDGWDHWEIICNTAWFKPYITKWRREAEIRQKSRALARVREEARSGSRDALNANKYLLEKRWIEKEPSTRGRPSKEEILKESELLLEKSNSKIVEDAARLGIKVN